MSENNTRRFQSLRRIRLYSIDFLTFLIDHTESIGILCAIIASILLSVLGILLSSYLISVHNFGIGLSVAGFFFLLSKFTHMKKILYDMEET